MRTHPWVAELERRRRHHRSSCPCCGSRKTKQLGRVPLRTARFTERVLETIKRAWVEVRSVDDQNTAKQLLGELDTHDPKDLNLLTGRKGRDSAMAESIQRSLEAIVKGQPASTAKQTS